MSSSEPRLEDLESLVEELIKKDPNDEWINRQMQRAGLKVTNDPIERINQVLTALHFAETKKVIKE